MKIAEYIGDLLYDYECVVIPGLGGFITKDTPAKVVAVTHHFKPPFKEVFFNVHLKANDGLLVNYVARRDNLSYQDSKARVDHFVHQCSRALEEGKRIRFRNIGTLSMDADSNIVFMQDKSINYNADAFGLGTFVSPAIERTSEEEKVLGAIRNVIPEKKATGEPEPKPKLRKAGMQATRKRSALARQLSILSIIFLVLGSVYTWQHRHSMLYYFNRHETKLPFHYSSAQAHMISNMGWLPTMEISKRVSDIMSSYQKPETNEEVIDQSGEQLNSDNKAETGTDNEPESGIIAESGSEILLEKNGPESVAGNEIVADASGSITISEEPLENDYANLNSVVDPKPELTTKEALPNQTEQPLYYIIAGSFGNHNNARALVKELMSKGFKAMIADTNNYGMVRVAFAAYSSEGEASEALDIIRREENPGAWILKK